MTNLLCLLYNYIFMYCRDFKLLYVVVMLNIWLDAGKKKDQGGSGKNVKLAKFAVHLMSDLSSKQD